MTRATGIITGLLLAALGACSPALDWRDVRPGGDSLVLLFPCRPEAHERTVRIAGADRRMRMLGCDAAGMTFSLASLDAEAADRVQPLLEALKLALAGNLGAAAGPPLPFAPAGATPSAGSSRMSVAGRRPDGEALRAETACFVHGLHVYQATVLGKAPSAEAVSTFMESARFAPPGARERSATR